MRLLCLVLVGCAAATTSFVQTGDPIDEKRPVSGTIGLDEIRRYRIHVDAGQVVLGTVEQKGIDHDIRSEWHEARRDG